MEWLDGHPLSMRLVLPRLGSAEPRDAAGRLQGTAPLPGGDAGGGRTRRWRPASATRTPT